MQTCKLVVTGESLSDMDDAIEEALRLIRNGNTSGFNQNETGSFAFTMEEVNDG